MFLRAALDGSYASRPKRLERGSGTSERLGQRTAVDGRTPLTPTVMRQRRNHTSRQSERPRATSLAIYYTAGRHGAGKGEPIHYSGSRRGAHRTTHILSSVLSRMSQDFVYGPRLRQ